MRLKLGSRLLNYLHASWPPETVDALSCEGGVLTLRFRDHWKPYFVGDDFEWEAKLDHNNGTWRLIKLRKLDYDGPDAPI
jgi:hypothetical protein